MSTNQRAVWSYLFLGLGKSHAHCNKRIWAYMEGVGSMSGMAENEWNVRAATSCGYIFSSWEAPVGNMPGMTVQGYASDRHSCANNTDTSRSYQLSSVHRVWYHTWSWKRMWDHDRSKSVFTFPQSTNSKAWSTQNLMRASTLNIRHSCCSCEGWSTEQPLHLNSIAWSRKQCTWRAVVWASCSWHSMVDWLVWDASSTCILWSYF